MTPDELRDLTHRLVDAQRKISRYQAHRPRKAAKILCAELRALQERSDFWTELATTAEKVAPYRKEADALLADARRLFNAEAEVLIKLGVDTTDIGNVLSLVFDAVDMAKARDIDTNGQTIRNLQDRLGRVTDLICRHSRGPLLQAADYLVSRKGAATVAALGLGSANVWFAITADGGALSNVSIKLAVAVASGKIDDIGGILGG